MSQSPLRFGVLTPIVSLNPRRQPTWEIDSGPEELRQIALTADRLGYHHLTCSEHVIIPSEVAKARGARYYDPLATFGFMAAITKRVRFTTHVLVLPYHHHLAVAKRYGTLDRMSGGRLILGIGVCTLREEFDLLGAQFEGRGDIYTDGLKALRAALGKREPSYHGAHYHFEGMVVDPYAVQEHVPIWIGGKTPRSLRRALEAADGWDPEARGGVEELGRILQRAKQWPEWHQRRAPLDIVLQAECPHDPTHGEDTPKLVDFIAKYQRAGATILNLHLKGRTLPHYLEQLEAFQAKIAPRFG
ncbi:MAG: TIGR03619 family F420-dependent LLM class oxidoreductase [Chloroflexi bacterium]|nr:TIGR03619 family F420-dependent LLM class oxidoreductase [Chloroflexota bacterium]